MVEASHDLADACWKWWVTHFSEGNPASRRARARMRRVEHPIDALMIAETHDLARRLAEIGYDMINRADDLAAIAISLSQIKFQGGLEAACAFGQGMERRNLSEHRFNHMIGASTRFGLAQHIIRNLPIIDHSANIGSLGEDIFFWGDKVRTKWSFAYYGAGSHSLECRIAS